MKRKVLVISGPTGAGKSCIADFIADRCDAVIINADSRQVYREIPLITDQPSEANKKTGRYALYGYISINEYYSVAKWLHDVGRVIVDVLDSGKLPIVVGGSVMYIHSLINGLSVLPSIKPELLTKWDNLYKTFSKANFEDLVVKTLGHNGEYKDRYRVVRNLAMFEQTGKELVQLHSQTGKMDFLNKSVEFDLAILLPAREQLYKSINLRAFKMLEYGIISEIQNVISANPNNINALSSIGIKEFTDYVSGNILLEEAINVFQCKSRRYAKKQITWCKHKFNNKSKLFTDKGSLIDYCTQLYL